MNELFHYTVLYSLTTEKYSVVMGYCALFNQPS